MKAEAHFCLVIFFVVIGLDLATLLPGQNLPPLLTFLPDQLGGWGYVIYFCPLILGVAGFTVEWVIKRNSKKKRCY